MFFDGQVFIEQEDQCDTCAHFMKGIACPLLQALALKLAYLEGDMLVRQCQLYEKYERPLRVVK